MMLRPYRKEDCEQTARLFYETVHAVNAKDYAPRQLAAWAPAVPQPEAWHASFCGHYALVAEEDGAVIGFGDIDATGYLDRLYVHKGHQGRGVPPPCAMRWNNMPRAGRLLCTPLSRQGPFLKSAVTACAGASRCCARAWR